MDVTLLDPLVTLEEVGSNLDKRIVFPKNRLPKKKARVLRRTAGDHQNPGNLQIKAALDSPKVQVFVPHGAGLAHARSCTLASGGI